MSLTPQHLDQAIYDAIGPLADDPEAMETYRAVAREVAKITREYCAQRVEAMDTSGSHDYIETAADLCCAIAKTLRSVDQ